ncbi:MAG: hypothetical protein JO078_02615 [Candidatus Eremiobacteraeota bacterium]|nr:hypothetical protein [Candidatus Eremiobacteraeota bacterium]
MMRSAVTGAARTLFVAFALCGRRTPGGREGYSVVLLHALSDPSLHGAFGERRLQGLPL